MKRQNRSKLAESIPAVSRGSSIPAGGGCSARASSGWTIALAAGLIVVAAAAAYSNSLQGPFVFDDKSDIVENASIKRLWPIWNVFVFPSNGRAALHGRPVVNLSLALNYAVGGLEPFLYHVANLLVHVLAGLTLFGIVRRTLLLPSLGGRFAAAATPMALAVALIWVLHPLQTAAVTYVVQRYESMMGLFYLSALYAAVRCGTSAHPRGWAVAAAAAALLGMGCKEVAVSIPITILLYDRAFLAGSFRAAFRRRWGMYLGLAVAWAAFAVLFAFSYSRGSWAGYGLPFSWIEYARSQFGVILHYLRLSFWPRPLVLDYGWPVARTAGEILPGAAVIGGLAAATAYALIRWPKWGFLGAWFFLILAPTSSVMPLGDLAFEYRMYLPLAALATGCVAGGFLAGRWLVDHGIVSRPAWQVANVSSVMLACVVFGILTFQRNVDYRSELSIWEDTVGKAPDSPRAHNNLAVVLVDCRRTDEAIAHYNKALELSPDYAEAHYNFGAALAGSGRIDEAMAHYEQALKIKPDSAKAHNNLGVALADRGRINEAMAHYQRALEIKPDYAKAHYNFGVALGKCGRIDEAMAHYRKALEIQPDFASADNNLGTALARRGRFDEAMVHYQRALEIKPDYAEARKNLGVIRLQREEMVKALAERRDLLRARPDDVALLNDTAAMLATNPNASIRNGAEAVELAQRAVQLSGEHEPAVLGTLAAAYAEAGRFAEAVRTARKALQLATQQNQKPLAESIQAKLLLYEAGTPFRETKRPVAPDSPQP